VAVVALGQTVHQPTAFANGGTVQWRKQAGSFLITVFTAPAPLSGGPGVISLHSKTASVVAARFSK